MASELRDKNITIRKFMIVKTMRMDEIAYRERVRIKVEENLSRIQLGEEPRFKGQIGEDDPVENSEKEKLPK